MSPTISGEHPPRQDSRPELAELLARATLVDLTLLLAEELPCWWSNHMPYQQKTFNYFTDVDDVAAPLQSRTGPYQTRWLLIDEHTGTHCDAPAHFVPPPGSGLPGAGAAGEMTADRIPLTQLAGPAVVIDVPENLPGAAPGVSPYITAPMIERHEERHGRIHDGEIVLFRSGWDSHYRPGADGNRYCYDPLVTRAGEGWPAPDVGAMQLLLSRGVRCIGTDAPSMGSCHDGGPVHVAGLSAGAVFVEALCHLDELPNRGAWFFFAPLNLRRGSGAPGRAVALIPPVPTHREDQDGAGT